MNDDLLERTTRALRDSYTAERSERGQRGERRLAAALRRPHRRSRFPLVASLIAASLAGAGAWAGVTGHLPRWLVARSHTTEHLTGPVIAPSKAPENHTIEEPSSAPSFEPRSEPTQAPEPAQPPVVKRATSAEHTASGSRGKVPAAPLAPQPPDLDALYQAAHEAHFTQRDPAAALVAWDRYLQAAGPSGRMALEARYNRAIALVRLGRNEEARAALQPFARGEYGGYRQSDALRLLESLR